MTIAGRTGGAPISWGVCEAPDWGYELPADLVLSEMRDLGLRATELGPTGYLGTEPADIRARLDSRGLRLIGGFLPVPMHVNTPADLDEATAAIRTLAAAGSEVVVLAARSADGSYDREVPLDDGDWTVLLATLRELQRVAADHGLVPTLHPHVGTAIEDRASVLRLLDGSDVLLCLDTGHLLIGGTDPAELTRQVPERIAHTHLKDVDAALAERVRRGELSYSEAVDRGMYRPLGRGDVDFGTTLRALAADGYSGWFVMEQDTILHAEPPAGAGPLDDVRASLAYLSALAAATGQEV